MDASKQSNRDERLDSFLDSANFLNNAYIKSLLDKSISLGFALEVIKETFYRFLLAAADFELGAEVNYARLIDEEKFIERLILTSIQLENSGGKVSNAAPVNHNELDDYDEDDELKDELPVADFSAYEMPKYVAAASAVATSVESSKRLPVQTAVKKPATALTVQQKLQQEQEFLAQSMNRINDKSNLRPIIVDGNDVALSSSSKQVFMFGRIRKVVDYFEQRQHQIYVILSSWRKEQIMAAVVQQNPATSVNGSCNSNGLTQGSNSSNNSSSLSTPLSVDQLALIEMEQKNQIHYTPSKRVGAKRIVCDDDSYLLKLAVSRNGVIVSNDNFKKHLNTANDETKLVIEERVLMYSFIDDEFMPAEDPLGKNGPSLDNFLRFESFTNQQYMKRCPYRKKCTYGSKCKFWHPERGTNQQGNQLFKTAHQYVLDEAQEQKMRLEIILNKNQQDVYTTSSAKKSSLSPPNREKPNEDDEDEFKNISDDFAFKSDHQPRVTMTRLRQKQSTSGLFSEFEPSKQPSQISKQFQPSSERVQQNVELRVMGPTEMMLTKKQHQQQQNPLSTNLKSSLLDSNPTMSRNNSGLFAGAKPFQLGTTYSSTIWDGLGKVTAAATTKPADSDTIPYDQHDFDSYNVLVGSLANKTASSKLSRNETSLRAQLAAQLSPELVNEVLKRYQDETDIDKLVFLARGISFSCDF